MRLAVFLVFGFLFGRIEGQALEEIVASHTLTHVKLYQNRAEMTLIAQVHVAGGNSKIVFSGLSKHLDNNSLRVKGTGGGVIMSVQPRTNYLQSHIHQGKIKTMRDSVEYFTKRQTEAAYEMQVLEEEQKLILLNNKLGSQEKGFTLDELKNLADYYRSRLLEIKAKWYDLQRKHTEITTKISNLNQQLSQLNAQGRQPTYEAVIEFFKEHAGNITLELTYLASNAGWRPHYDIRTDALGEPGSLVLKAFVTNQTGIDWKNVSIVFSTASPTDNAIPPVLSNWYLTPANPQPEPSLARRSTMMKQQSAAASAAESADSYADDDASAKRAAPTPRSEHFSDYVTAMSNNFALEFAPKLTANIPTGTNSQTIQVKTFTIPVSYDYFSIPKLDASVFMQATLRDYQQYDLLPAPAAVYYKGSYIGTTNIDPRSTGDSITIGLGKDRNVTISREKVKDLTVRKVLGSNIREKRTFLIKVRNGKNEPVTLTIEDQIPISQHSDITVEDLETAGAKYNKDTGKLTWNLNLMPGQLSELRFSFQVKYPKDMPITGW